MSADETSRRRRLLQAFVAMLAISSCNRIAGPETMAVRRSLADRVLLLEPNGRSYVAHGFDSYKRVVVVMDHQPVSFAPDLSAYAYTKVTPGGGGRSFSVVLARPDGNEVPLTSVATTSGPPNWKLRWGSGSVYPLIVQIDDRLLMFCQDQEQRTLSSGVIDFDVGGDRLWLLRYEAGRKDIIEGRIAGDGLEVVHRLSAPREVDGIVWSKDSQVVAFTTAPDLHIRERLSLIDVIDGRLTHLPVPSGVRVLDIVPIRGSSRLLLDEWRGEENVDGSILSKLYLLDYGTGRHTWIWTNHHDELLHERPANAARLTCTAR